MFRLWIDDLRTPPDETWRWAKSVHEAKLRFIQLGGLNGKEGIVSLDHDAAEYAFMGGDYIEFLNWLEGKKYLDHSDFSHVIFHFHSMNPVGVRNMRTVIKHNRWKEIHNI